jgi:hypothetical protein
VLDLEYSSRFVDCVYHPRFLGYLSLAGIYKCTGVGQSHGFNAGGSSPGFDYQEFVLSAECGGTGIGVVSFCCANQFTGENLVPNLGSRHSLAGKGKGRIR